MDILHLTVIIYDNKLFNQKINFITPLLTWKLKLNLFSYTPTPRHAKN